MEEYDVLIVGAGAAGMLAALEIALTGRKVCILEANDRAGGRMYTVHTPQGYPVELGAEFVHGNLSITSELLKKAGAAMYPVNGSIWQKKDGVLQEQNDFIKDYSDLEKKFRELHADLPVKDFFDTYINEDRYEELRFTLQNYVEGYYAADLNKASTFALRDELTKADEEQYRINGGYRMLVDYLGKQCKEKGVHFFFQEPVLQLHWKHQAVNAITERGSFHAKKALITVSIGVLREEGITFTPSLPQKKEAAGHLGFGHVLKTNIQFENAFWKNKEQTEKKDLKDLNFLFSEEVVPTWWTQFPKEEPILTGWLGGPKAHSLLTLDKDALLQKSRFSLSRIFDVDVLRMQQQITQEWTYNWTADPFYLGAYSYAVIDGEKYMKLILEPVDSTLYFAGEGLHHGHEIGTVEAALQSGRSVAHRLIAET